MRTLFALSLLLAVGACGPAPETPAAPPAETTAASDPFDAAAWLAAAAEVGFDPEQSSYDDDQTAREKALSDELDAVVGWRQACNTTVDPDTYEVFVSDEPDDAFGWTRGTVQAFPIGDGAIVAVTCTFGAYQGGYALAHVSPGHTALLTAAALDEAGQPLDVQNTTFATPLSLDAEGLLATFGKSRGIGDCGRYVTYRFDGTDSLAVDAVRQQDCVDDGSVEPGSFETWPLVYSAS